MDEEFRTKLIQAGIEARKHALDPIKVYGIDGLVDPVTGPKCPYREEAFQDEKWKKHDLDIGCCTPWRFGFCGGTPWYMKTCYKYNVLVRQDEKLWYNRLKKWLKFQLSQVTKDE